MVFGQAVCLVLKLKWIVVLLVMEAKAMDLYALTFHRPETRTHTKYRSQTRSDDQKPVSLLPT